MNFSKADPTSDAMDMPKFRLGHVSIDNVTLEEAADWVMRMTEAKSAKIVLTPNSDHIIQLERDITFRTIYRQGDLIVADGMPIVWASHLNGTPLKERVAGSDLGPLICKKCAQNGKKVFFLGAGPGVARRAARRMSRKYPGLDVCGTYSPSYGFENDPDECAQIVEMIVNANPDVVLVGLGAPKQEQWMVDYRDQFAHGVLIGVGATLDFMAGTAKRAPKWMRRLGAEWVYRLFHEPVRLVGRYIRDLAIVGMMFRCWRRRRRFARTFSQNFSDAVQQEVQHKISNELEDTG